MIGKIPNRKVGDFYVIARSVSDVAIRSKCYSSLNS